MEAQENTNSPELEKTYEAPVVFSVTKAQIAELRAKFMGLKVANVNDKASYDLCKKSRGEVRGYRLQVVQEHKLMKAGALAFGRKCDASLRELLEMFEEIESHLKAEEAIIDDEKKRLEEEALRAFTERRNARVAQLQACKVGFNYDEVANMTDEAFAAFIAEAQESFEVSEKIRIANEARLAELEAERLANEERVKAAQEETRKVQAELLRKQQEELAAKEREIAASRAAEREAERKANEERIAREREAAAIKEAEDKRLAEEIEKKRLAENEAAKKIADKKLFDKIKVEFPTLESAWVEIARLRKAAGSK